VDGRTVVASADSFVTFAEAGYWECDSPKGRLAADRACPEKAGTQNPRHFCLQDQILGYRGMRETVWWWMQSLANQSH
jgi:hypothetical protein